jgi:hypothetical protein
VSRTGVDHGVVLAPDLDRFERALACAPASTGSCGPLDKGDPRAWIVEKSVGTFQMIS